MRQHSRRAGLVIGVLAVLGLTIPALAGSPSSNQGECPDGYTSIGSGFSGLSWTANGDYAVVILVGGPPGDENQDPDGRDKVFTDVSAGDVLSREAHDISHICVLAPPPTTPPTTAPTTTTTTQPGTQYFVGGYCATDQTGDHRPLADLDSSTREDPFILNGVNVGVVAFGVDAKFGHNTWSNGEASGSFDITDVACASGIVTPPPTTIGEVPPIVPDDPASPTTNPPTVPVDPTAPDPTAPVETLPFTGPGSAIELGVAGGVLLALGGLTLYAVRGRLD